IQLQRKARLRVERAIDHDVGVDLMCNNSRLRAIANRADAGPLLPPRHAAIVPDLQRAAGLRVAILERTEYERSKLARIGRGGGMPLLVKLDKISHGYVEQATHL